MERLGLDPATVRDTFISMGIDDDLVLDMLVDPNVDYDYDVVEAMLDAAYNPLEVIYYTEYLAETYASVLGNDDISKKMAKLVQDLNKAAKKRQSQTKAMKQNKFKFESSADLADSAAGYCMGTTSDSSGSFFVGVGRRSVWSNDIVVGWGNNMCTSATDSYSISFYYDGQTIETGKKISCDYEFAGKNILERGSGNTVDKKLYSKSNSKALMIGITDDVANALNNLDAQAAS